MDVGKPGAWLDLSIGGGGGGRSDERTADSSIDRSERLTAALKDFSELRLEGGLSDDVKRSSEKKNTRTFGPLRPFTYFLSI